MNRRTWLKVGGLNLGALTMGAAPNLARLFAAESSSTIDRDFSVILFWANGGPSHLETFDLKPDAPEDIRGHFKPIRTNVTGTHICEHLPKLAKMADKFTILRSLHHQRGEHSGGTHRFLTGHSSIAANLPNSENPEIGSIIARHLSTERSKIPAFIGNTQFYGGGPAYLGKAHAPFMPYAQNSTSASGNNTYEPIPIYPPDDPQRGINLDVDSTLRLEKRADLLQQMDSFRRSVDQSEVLDTWEVQHRRALEILSNGRTRDAFDLSKEPEKVRKRYGNSHWGKSLLTCRRLIEAGARFVQCQATYRLPKDVGRTSNWDDHSVNTHIFKSYQLKLPVLDHVISTLIQDLYERGMDKHVLFIFCGEFGRTPIIRNQDKSKRPGRDHWPKAMSVFLSGGGMKMGQVIGSTNSRGERPKDRPMTPNHLWATMFKHLGIDYENTAFLDHSGRPMPILPSGEPIHELF